jgi:hypothetical protein
MKNPILIFEQDCLHQDTSGAILNKDYVKDHLAYLTDEHYPEVDVVHEYEDESVVIYQGFNEGGESWKFIQAKG